MTKEQMEIIIQGNMQKIFSKCHKPGDQVFFIGVIGMK